MCCKTPLLAPRSSKSKLLSATAGVTVVRSILLLLPTSRLDCDGCGLVATACEVSGDLAACSELIARRDVARRCIVQAAVHVVSREREVVIAGGSIKCIAGRDDLAVCLDRHRAGFIIGAEEIRSDYAAGAEGSIKIA